MADKAPMGEVQPVKLAIYLAIMALVFGSLFAYTIYSRNQFNKESIPLEDGKATFELESNRAGERGLKASLLVENPRFGEAGRIITVTVKGPDGKTQSSDVYIERFRKPKGVDRKTDDLTTAIMTKNLGTFAFEKGMYTVTLRPKNKPGVVKLGINRAHVYFS